MENCYKSTTATIGTQVWQYHMVNMFDDFQAADYEHGNVADMEKRFNDIRTIYIQKGYRVKDWEITRSHGEVRKTFGVYDVPLKCLKGHKAKTLLVHLWIKL